MKTLHLTLKKKWFDMIASGEKKEEYREIKPYWERRLVSTYNDMTHGHMSKRYPALGIQSFNKIDTITFTNGYGKDAPRIVVECECITIGTAKPEWSDNWPGEVFIIKLGKIIQP